MLLYFCQNINEYLSVGRELSFNIKSRCLHLLHITEILVGKTIYTVEYWGGAYAPQTVSFLDGFLVTGSEDVR